MGCPVKSVKDMEDNLRCRRQKLVIVILASANSDSQAVEFVLRNFHEMDSISDDVDFYMPGYGVGNNKRYMNPVEANEFVTYDSVKLFPDFHSLENEHSDRSLELFRDRNNGITLCQVIDSPRLGYVLFNVAEFTDFVMEFTKRIGGFHYMGGCQMVLLQPKSDGTPNYNQASFYDLDSVINSHCGPSLDSFFHRVFQLIRDPYYDDRYYRSHSSVFSKLLRNVNRHLSTGDIVSRIDELYYEATRVQEREERYEIIINNIILDMNRCLDWDIRCEDFYFISYSSRNVLQAETLKKHLQKRNVHVWIAPDGIPQGREYPVVIPTALKLAKVFVLLLTPDSAKSPWVKRELAIAIGNSANTKVKVLLSEGMTISDIRNDVELEFLLDRVQVRYDYSDVVHSEAALESFIYE